MDLTGIIAGGKLNLEIFKSLGATHQSIQQPPGAFVVEIVFQYLVDQNTGGVPVAVCIGFFCLGDKFPHRVSQRHDVLRYLQTGICPMDWNLE